MKTRFNYLKNQTKITIIISDIPNTFANTKIFLIVDLFMTKLDE